MKSSVFTEQSKINTCTHIHFVVKLLIIHVHDCLVCPALQSHYFDLIHIINIVAQFLSYKNRKIMLYEARTNIIFFV